MTLKVIQWSSGNVGAAVMRSIAHRDDMELVGLFVSSSQKSGRDAGDIIGLDPTGVIATDDREAILNLEADVVIHTPLPSLVYGDNPDTDVDDFVALLESGKDVITTVGYMYPKVYGPGLVARLEDACARGGSTFHSTGLNPGWLGDVIPLTMTSLSSRIDQIYVREITNFEFYPSPEILFDMMGFGKSDVEFEVKAKRHRHWLTHLFRENIQMIADGIGMELDDIVDTTERAYAPADLKTAAGTVAEGTIAGQHWEWAGVRNGEKLIVHETVWRMHASVATEWPDGDHSVVIEGKPRMRLNFDANWINDGLLATGMHALNAVPYVVDAPAGIKTLLDLPWIMGRAKQSVL